LLQGVHFIFDLLIENGFGLGQHNGSFLLYDLISIPAERPDRGYDIYTVNQLLLQQIHGNLFGFLSAA